MDITQLYIQQQFGDKVKPWYSQTNCIQGSVAGGQNIIEANFINEKVKLIICTQLFISYDSAISPVQVRNMYDEKVFETPTTSIAIQTTGIFAFNYIQEGAAIKFIASNAGFKFSLFFYKVFLYNDKP